MKKVTAILFFALFMISATHINELLKLPEFISHYIEHKNADAHLDFWKFLAIHYMQEDIKDADYAKDMKLPFKTLISNSNATSLYTPCTEFYSIKEPSTYFTKPQLTTHLALYSSIFAPTIWQPPKKTC